MAKALLRLSVLVALFAVSTVVLYVWRGDGSLLDRLRGKLRGAVAGQQGGAGAGGAASPGGRKHEPFTLPEDAPLSAEEVPGLVRMSIESARVAERVIPSVVSITTAETVRDDDGMAATRRRLGAGVIVTEEGHIITANHVVYGVQSVLVRLADDRLLPVEMVGVNPRSDIAVLKIIAPDRGETFPALAFVPDSDTVRQGEFAFSFGNPYGLRGSSDFGVISAKERRFSNGSADLFQTSTRMLPGHSGGPLVNVFGQVIGINTAIYREDQRAPVWTAVGMAIVANDARDVLEMILRRGKPVYGHLGVHVEVPAVYSHLSAFDLALDYPVQVESVEPGSAAERAGIQGGDIIREFAGEPVDNFNDFKRLVRRRQAGEEVSLVVTRNGRDVLLKATVAELDPQAIFARMEGWTEERAATSLRRALGAEVSNLSAAQKREFGMQAAAGGVIVNEVIARTPAQGRLQPGDVVQICNGVLFQNARQFAKLVEDSPTQRIDLLVTRSLPSGGRVNLMIELEPVRAQPEAEEPPPEARVQA